MGLVIGLALVYFTKPKTVTTSKPVPETVFVDLNRLISLHPNYLMLDELEKIKNAISVHKTDFGGLEYISSIPPALSEAQSVDVTEETRQNMSDMVLNSADRALSAWETDRKKAVGVRLDWSKKNMLARARDDIWAKKNEIYASSGDKKLDIETRYGLDLVNYRLAIRELELGNNLHGYEPPEIPPRLSNMRTSYDTLNNKYLEEHHKADSWTISEIDKIGTQALADANSVIARRQERSNEVIQSDIASARNRISERLESVNTVQLKRLYVISGVDSEPRAVVTPIVPQKKLGAKGAFDSASLTGEILKQIRADLASVVLEEAQQTGVKVVFNRSEETNVRDATQTFYNFISSSVW